MVLWRWVVVAGVVSGGVAVVRVDAQRLPGGVRPEHYSLTITPDLRGATFSGSERVEVVLDRPVSAITLNAAEIEFVEVKAFAGGLSGEETKANTGVLRSAQNDSLGGRDGGVGQAAVVTLDAAKEQATFTFARTLPAGRVALKIEYQGILNNKLRGFYLSKTKARSYGVTQFEATDARRAFPSFDEPALKATFDVTLVVDAGDTAISNTNIVSDTPGPADGKHTIAFAATPMMSTYLVAWLVGDFACTEGKSDGVPIRACSTPDKVGLTRFALDAAKWDLHYYDKYFGIKYPMAKLDMVAIPDFEAGAMENFGCITYRETEMLVDEKHGTLPARKDVATTVAHEIAHQWFGDLVTPDWWDNLWLNEGFATWMESKAAAKNHPKWKYAQDEAVDLNRSMDEDGERTTRAIRARARTPSEINEMFDDIAYGKAGAVIGMVENWVGEEAFRRGVQAYLAAHVYGNATAEDFWTEQARVSGLPVDKVMRSFVGQPGVPEVVLGKSAATGVLINQTEFVLSATKSACATTEAGASRCSPRASVGVHTWTIPICFKGGACQLLLDDSRSNATILAAPATPFVYANAGDKGYYRTEYAAPLLAAIVANVETGLTPPERIGLLGDRWALMRAGQGTVGDFLDLAVAVKQDSDATVLGTAVGRVEAIASLIATDDDRERLDSMVRREFGPVYAALGGPKKREAYDHAELRGTLFEALGKAKDPAVLTQADSLTKQIFAGHKPSDPMIADAAIALITPKGDAEMYDRLVRLRENATDPDFKESALHALTRFEAPELVTRTLEYALSDEVRSQDSWTLIAQLLERRETQEQAWAFVQQHWAGIERKSTVNSGARIVAAAGAFCTVEKRDEVSSFFRAHRVASSERTLAKALDNINDCVLMRSAQEPELRRWLDGHGGS
jgi:aminopeptidase N